MDKELNANAKLKKKKQAKRSFRRLIKSKKKKKFQVAKEPHKPNGLSILKTTTTMEKKKTFKSFLFNISKWTAVLVDKGCFSQRITSAFPLTLENFPHCLQLSSSFHLKEQTRSAQLVPRSHRKPPQDVERDDKYF